MITSSNFKTAAALLALSAAGWYFYRRAQKEPLLAIGPDFESRTGIPVAQIAATLKDAKIPHEVISDPVAWLARTQRAPQTSFNPPVDLLHSPREVIWEDKTVQVVLVDKRGSHLLIKPTGNVSYSEISDEQFLALKETVRKVVTALPKVFGSSDFAEAIVGDFAIEIFPGSSEIGELDQYIKDQRNIYFLTQGQAADYSLPPDKLSSLKTEISHACNHPEPFQLKTSSFEPYTRDETNWSRALSYRIDTLFRIWSNTGIPVLRLTPKPLPLTGLPHSRFRTSKECIFCKDPDPRELIFEGKTLRILTNIFPYAGRNEENTKHALIVFKRHTADNTALTPEEILEAHQASLKLRKIFHRLHPLDTTWELMQQGISAGQTVRAHPHIHLISLKTPDEYMHQWALEALGRRSSPVFPANANIKSHFTNT